MSSLGYILIAVIGLLLLQYVLFLLLHTVKSVGLERHGKWLEQQTPVGTWEHSTDETTTIVQFEGGLHDGIYTLLFESGGKWLRESGHWKVRYNTLELLVSETEMKYHRRFGPDNYVNIQYLGPNSISILGSNRQDLIFERSEESLPVTR